MFLNNNDGLTEHLSPGSQMRHIFLNPPRGRDYRREARLPVGRSQRATLHEEDSYGLIIRILHAGFLIPGDGHGAAGMYRVPLRTERHGVGEVSTAKSN